MVVTEVAIMVINLTTARIEQRFCLSCWSSWSWSSRDMIQVLSGSDIIVAVPGGVRAWGTKNANITQFLLVCKKRVNLRRPDRAQRSGWRWEHQSWREQSVEQGGVELQRWGGQSTVRSSSWRSTLFLTSSLLNKKRMLSLLIYCLAWGTRKESSHNLQKC